MPDSPRPLGFWVALVDRLVDERFAAALQEHGVTRGQFHLLSILRRGPLPQAAIAEATHSSNARPDDLNELIDSGWIQSDGAFSLTERGHSAAERLAKIVDGIVVSVDRAVAPTERAAMAAGLEAVARSFGWSDGEA